MPTNSPTGGTPDFDRLKRPDPLGLKTLRSLLGLVVDLLSFDQLAIARALDGREVCEDVGRAVVRGNKTEALGGVEPLHGTCGHDVASFLHAGDTCGRPCGNRQRRTACVKFR